MGHSVMSNRVGNGMVSNWVSNGMDKRGSVVSNGDSLRVGSSARVGDLSDVTIDVVGVVGHSLDTSVRKVDRVGSLNNTGAIVALGLAEGSARVLVSHSIVVGVGGDLSKVGGSIADSVVGNRGSMDNRGMVNNRGMVDHRGGMDQGCGMGNTMANNTVSKAVSGNNSVSETVSGQELRGGRGSSMAETVSGQELRGGRGSSQQGGDASEGLHIVLSWAW